jgi:hypothetical protein
MVMTARHYRTLLPLTSRQKESPYAEILDCPAFERALEARFDTVEFLQNSSAKVLKLDDIGISH